jgi:integrase
VYVRKRGNRWQGRVAVQGYPEQLRTFGTEAEAWAWGAEVDKRIREGGYSRPDETTLAGALRRYVREVTEAKKGAVKEASIIRRILAHPMTNLPLAKVRGAEISSYRDQMKAQGYAPATVSRHLAVLSNLFSVAQTEWSLEVGNPVKQIKKPVIRNERSKRVSDAEISKLLGASGSSELGAVALLALETCMRRSELLKLCWSSIDLAKHVAMLNDTKNGHCRPVPLSSKAMELITQLPHRTDDKLFGLACDSVTQAFARASKRAGLRDIRFHDLRREGISRLAERGLSVLELAAISGHRDLRVLSNRYAHLQAEDLAKKLK